MIAWWWYVASHYHNCCRGDVTCRDSDLVASTKHEHGDVM
jgi:hypothetical protein